jgi:hypothetical protein
MPGKIIPETHRTSESKLDRRAFLRRAAALGVGAAALPMAATLVSSRWTQRPPTSR